MPAISRIFVPIFADALRPRLLPLMLAGIGALQLGCSAAFNLGLPCPFYKMTGLPCPGCGLTRSVLAICRGHLWDSFKLHPFGSLLFAGLVFSLIVGLLPQKSSERLVHSV